MTAVHDQPDTALRQVAPSLIEGLPALFDELQSQLAALETAYSEFISESRELVLYAASRAVLLLVDVAEQIVAGGDSAVGGVNGFVLHEGEAGQFEEIGRVQCREGLPVGTLLSAYQLGARVWWRRMSATALRMGLEPASLAALAEALFCFVDQLCTASAAGYLAEQAESSVARERSRDELVELLLSERSTVSAVRAAALRAEWPLPDAVAIVLIDPRNEIGRQTLARLDASCLMVRTPALLGAIVPDPDAPGRRQRLATLLSGSSAVIGHSVDLALLPASARIAEIAAQLQRENILRMDPVFVDDHSDAIIVHRDPGLLAALTARCLAPLASAPAASQQPLRETLTCWLRTMGDRRQMAEELHVHPQTVRYRVARLRELFGDALSDPQARLELTLALCWSQP